MPVRILRAVLLAGLLWGGALPAQADIEVVPLRYRTVDQVLPVLRPLLEPGGALSGMQGQLVIRASAANLAELKRVLASLDTRPRRLVVSVRQHADDRDERRDASVSGTLRSGRVAIGNEGRRSESGVGARLGETESTTEDRVEQRIQVMEGGIAQIQVGQSVPLAGRAVTRGPGGTAIHESIAYRNATTGFEVLPRVAGDRVTLEINPRRESLGAGGSINVQRISTSVSGRLGEWIDLGSMAQQISVVNSGLLSRSGSARQGARRVSVKVEALD